MRKPAGSSGYWIYVLESEGDGSRYVGMTRDVQLRLREHNGGKVRYTSAHRPFRLIYFEFIGPRLEARQRERYLKSSAGRRFLKKLLTKS